MIQITITKNKKGTIIIGPVATERIRREYYEQNQTHKFNNLEEMIQFPNDHKLVKLNPDEIDNLINFITIKEIEFLFLIFLEYN